MGTILEITTTNYDGQSADITFFPCSGGSIDIRNVRLPYNYESEYYFGTYRIYIFKYNKTCTLVVPCPPPTTTPTNTPTPTSPLTCSASVVPPTTINGVVITDSSTGNVLTATSAYPSCGSSVTTPANSKWVGFGTPPNAVFTYTMNFSVPINNLIVFIAGAGANAFPTETENYIFTTNTGTGVPSITSSINCFTTIVNNQLFISYGTSTNGGGGKFLITNNVNFTSVTISGDGGLGGSFLSVCTNSILPPSSPTPTITPTPTPTQPFSETFTMSARSLNSFSLISGTGFRIVASLPFRVVWGDGDITDYPSGTINISHDYLTPYTGNILIKSSDLTSITSLIPDNVLPQITETSVRYLEIETSQLNLLDGLLVMGVGVGEDYFSSGNISLLPSTLTTFVSRYSNCSGDIGDLPSNLQNFSVNFLGSNANQSNSISGNVFDLPVTLTTFQLAGNNIITGNVNDFPSLLTDILVYGQNTIDGDISLMNTPNLNRIQIDGNNQISGDLGGLSNSVNTVRLYGQNYVTGDISTLPTNVVEVEVLGVNTLYGDVGSLNYLTLSFFGVYGSNTISGNTSSINLKTSANFIVDGNNTITGDIGALGNSNAYGTISIDGNNTINGNIQDLPSNAKRIDIRGNNQISGDLSLIHLNIIDLTIRGNNTISTFSNSSRIFTNLGQIVIIGSGFNSTNVDNLLTSYSNSTWGLPKRLTIKGVSVPKYTNQPAYDILQITKGVTITIS